MMLNRLFKQARLAAGMTQEQIADQIGLTPSAYGKIESGLRGMGMNYIRPLCNVLSVTYADALDALCPLFQDAEDEDYSTQQILAFGTGEISENAFGFPVRDGYSRLFTRDELSFLDVLSRFTGLDRMDERVQKICDEAIFLRRRGHVAGKGME